MCAHHTGLHRNKVRKSLFYYERKKNLKQEKKEKKEINAPAGDKPKVGNTHKRKKKIK